MKINSIIRNSLLVGIAAFALLRGASSPAQQITFDHLFAGAVGTVNGDQLLWTDAAVFTNSSTYYQMDLSTSGQYAGYYNADLTMAVLAATSDNGGPIGNAPALGSYIQAKISLISAPDGGQFSFWEVGATAPTFTLNIGDTTPLIPISDVSLGAGTFGEDPFGHIDDRRWGATVLGDYLVGFQAIDTDDNGLDGLPIHTPSDTIYIDFRAVPGEVPEPATYALLGLGLLGFCLMHRHRRHLQPRAAHRGVQINQ